MKSFIKKLAISLIISILIYLNLQYWQVGIFGWILIIYYLLFIALAIQPILIKVFNFSDLNLRTKLFSALLSFYTLGLIGGIFILLSSFNNFIIALVILLNAVFWQLLNIFLVKKRAKEDNVLDVFKQGIAYAQEPKSKLPVLVYIVLAAFGFSLLYHSQTAKTILSPWQTIDHLYIYVFLASTIVLGFLLFSKLSSKFLLFLLIIHSFLLHSYLPLTHQLFYGADQWRLLAAENQVLHNQPLNIVLHDTEPASLVRALNPGKLAYSQLWSTKVILAKNFNLDLVKLDKWLSIALFAFFVPLLFYQSARYLNYNKRKSLLFVWLSFIFFPLQSLGSLTLPVSFGFIFFLLFLLLLLNRLRQPNKKQWAILFSLLALSLFGYSLYLILLALIWLVVEILLIIQRTNCPLRQRFKKITGLATFISLVLLVAFFIPVLEYLARYSYVDLSVNIFNQIKQFIGNLTAIYLAWGPRPHDILGGNLIFNQIPKSAFVSNALTYWRYWLPIFMIGFWLVFIYGLIKLITKKSLEHNLISILAIGLWLSYFIGFYWLSGGKNVSRRLDMVLATLTLIVFFYGLNKLFFSKELSLRRHWWIVAVLAIAISASYSLGPDMKAVGMSEYKVDQQVWFEVKDNNNFCIVADTYTLLPLEYFSSRQIEGGGFEMNWDFSQPERIEVLDEMDTSPSVEAMKKALVYTGTDRCYYISSDEVDIKGLKKINQYEDLKLYLYNK